MSKKIYNQNNLFMLSCQYARLLISLTAAAVAFFFLDKKETKNQERGDASTHWPYSRPAPSFSWAIALFWLRHTP